MPRQVVGPDRIGRGLPVEPGGIGLSEDLTAHELQVVAAERKVPRRSCHDGRVDPVTRLALQARDGDELSLAGFVRATQADVRRLAVHLVDAESADDVVQEVYLRAIPALARYRADAPARTWLLGIGRRTCADVIRRRTRRRRLWARAVSQPDAAGESGTAAPSGMVELDTLIAGLEPGRRDAFVLTQVLGLPYAEAAEVMGVQVGTVRSRVARARSDLLGAMADEAATGASG